VCDWDVGLFNLFLGVIAHVHWALRDRRVPVIYYACNNCYLTPRGYRGADTVWEYYFEPVIPAFPVSRIPARVVEWISRNPFRGRVAPGTGYLVDDVAFVTNDGAWHIEVDGETLRDTPSNHPPSARVRAIASEIVRRYVRPRQYIRDRADAFFAQHFAGRFVIGVQIRGTDANVDPTRYVPQTRVKLDEFVDVLRRLRRAHPGSLIFVASDEQALVDRMRETFGDVCAYDSIRHVHGDVAGRGPAGGILPAYLTQDPDRAALNGEHAVIEYLLLCRCNYLVHNFSSMPRAVLLTVPSMPQTNVDRLHDGDPFERDDASTS
jgi:hypothetical protein